MVKNKVTARRDPLPAVRSQAFVFFEFYLIYLVTNKRETVCENKFKLEPKIEHTPKRKPAKKE